MIRRPPRSTLTDTLFPYTTLFRSDPVVFFGSFSYLHNFKREDVSRTVLTGAPEGFPQTTTEFIGEVDAGDIIGFNIGVGLAPNERAAISLGYDQSLVGRSAERRVGNECVSTCMYRWYTYV